MKSSFVRWTKLLKAETSSLSSAGSSRKLYQLSAGRRRWGRGGAGSSRGSAGSATAPLCNITSKKPRLKAGPLCLKKKGPSRKRCSGSDNGSARRVASCSTLPPLLLPPLNLCAGPLWAEPLQPATSWLQAPPLCKMKYFHNRIV